MKKYKLRKCQKYLHDMFDALTIVACYAMSDRKLSPKCRMKVMKALGDAIGCAKAALECMSKRGKG